MDPLTIIAIVVISTLYGLAWHDQPAGNPEKKSPGENLVRPQQGRRT
jgi:hypothetical protein